MGSVFKKTVTRPFPPGAEIITRKGVRLARWRDARGKIRTAPVTVNKDGIDRIREESSTYFARHRNGDGIVVETPTGCHDETAARQVLAELERRAERVRAGLLTPAEDRIAEHLATPIRQHVDAYIASMVSRGVVLIHRQNTRRHLDCLIRDCGFDRLADLKREALERWLSTESTKTRRRGRLEVATPTAPLSSRSASGAPTRASAGSLPTRSRGCQRPMRRPTLAAAAGR